MIALEKQYNYYMEHETELLESGLECSLQGKFMRNV